MVRTIAIVLLLTGPVLAAEPQTWWRTDGATVVQDGNECSLSFFDKNRVTFTWNKETVEIRLRDDSFNFKPQTPVAIAVQVGDIWLGNSDKPFLLASGSSADVSLALTPSMIDPLLTEADHVTVVVGTEKMMRFDFNRAKMPALLKATTECRKRIH